MKRLVSFFIVAPLLALGLVIANTGGVLADTCGGWYFPSAGAKVETPVYDYWSQSNTAVDIQEFLYRRDCTNSQGGHYADYVGAINVRSLDANPYVTFSVFERIGLGTTGNVQSSVSNYTQTGNGWVDTGHVYVPCGYNVWADDWALGLPGGGGSYTYWNYAGMSPNNGSGQYSYTDFGGC